MRLHAVGGLCNRLRAILSHRAAFGPLDVIWEPDEYVSCARWDVVFEPLEGVAFYDAGQWDVESFGIADVVPAEWTRAYLELRPKPFVAGQIEGSTAKVGLPYAAIHVRRTDHVPNAHENKILLNPLEAYADFVRWDERVWIATDNAETQQRLFELIPRGKTLYELTNSWEEQRIDDHRRHTTLGHAVVDLYMCAGASHFMGTPGSSFSETVEIMRALRWPG